MGVVEGVGKLEVLRGFAHFANACAKCLKLYTYFILVVFVRPCVVTSTWSRDNSTPYYGLYGRGAILSSGVKGGRYNASARSGFDRAACRERWNVSRPLGYESMRMRRMRGPRRNDRGERMFGDGYRCLLYLLQFA